MKTSRALFLPVLLATLVANQLEVRGQTAPLPPGGMPAGMRSAYDYAGSTPYAGARESRRAQSQVPLGIPSRLGMPGSQRQAPPPYMMSGMGPPPPEMMGAMQAGYVPGGMMPMPGPGPGMPMSPSPYGGVAPAGYETDGGATGDYEMAGGDVCPMCGGSGCPNCSGGGLGDCVDHGLDCLHYLLPYPGGGWCSPRWFDVSAEFMYLMREDVGRPVDLMSSGPRGLGDPNIVLSTRDLDFDEEPGFRASAAYQIGSSGNLEFSYFGTFNWASSAAVTDPNDELFSIFSDFGTSPPPTGPPVITLGGFTDTDAAEFGSVAYSSAIDSYELNFRRRWMFPHCRVQGSWMMGARYFRLEEELLHQIRVNHADPNGGVDPVTGSLDYLVATDNSMTGFQIGGDLWATLIPGVQLGSDFKAGIYGNKAQQHTFITAQSLAAPIEETDDRDRASFVGEASVVGTWCLNQHLTLRGGYQVLYVTGVALAPENFNGAPPFIVGARNVFLDDEGEALYSGLTGGLEWMW